jgi:sulfide:quinone oxidoreductase
MFQFHVLGPFALLGESNLNYYAKRMFKWIYWNLLLKGKKFPLEDRMKAAHKILQGKQ